MNVLVVAGEVVGGEVEGGHNTKCLVWDDQKPSECNLQGARELTWSREHGPCGKSMMHKLWEMAQILGPPFMS